MEVIMTALLLFHQFNDFNSTSTRFVQHQKQTGLVCSGSVKTSSGPFACSVWFVWARLNSDVVRL